MAKEKETKHKTDEKVHHQRQTGGSACRSHCTGTGPREERPVTLKPRKEK